MAGTESDGGGVWLGYAREDEGDPDKWARAVSETKGEHTGAVALLGHCGKGGAGHRPKREEQNGPQECKPKGMGRREEGRAG